MNRADQIIVALDTADHDELKFLFNELEGHASFIKIGMELFYSRGPDIIKRCKDHSFKVFLDLKMHDIPTTVAKSASVLGKLGVDIINVHAAGGTHMMRAAYDSFRAENDSGKMIAVTQLTSTSEKVLQRELLISKTLNETVIQYAKNTMEAGLDGVVCSPHEVTLIKKELSNDFLCVTPGIRPESYKTSDDQVRKTTPKEALSNGSDYLVIGRPIIKADSPRDAFTKILEEME